MERERMAAIALWAAARTKNYGLAEKVLWGRAELVEERLGRLLEDLPPLTPEEAEELRRLFTAPLEELFPPRPLEEEVEYARIRYRGFYAHEAPRWFRGKYPPEPTIEGVLALGRFKGYWKEEEEEEARRLLEGMWSCWAQRGGNGGAKAHP